MASTAPLPPPPHASAEDRLALVERLLACDAALPCAEAAVEWLMRHADAAFSACLVRGEAGASWRCLAAQGLSEAQCSTLEAPDDAPEPPLGEVLTRGTPRFFPSGRRAPLPSLNAGLFAVPLGVDGAPGMGLLLISSEDGSLSQEVAWVAARLGTCLARLTPPAQTTALAGVEQALGERDQRLRDTEREARSERHRLDEVLDSVADPIILSDPSGGTVMMNGPAEHLFILPPDASDALQRRVRTNEEHFVAFLAHLLGSVEVSRWRGQLNLVDPATSAILPMEAVASKVLGDGGELTGIVTLFHDRTEALERARLLERLKEASSHLEARVQTATAELAEQNEKLRRQAIQLEQASAAKSQFLANMSHELRTPLNAILGYTNMLLRGVSGELSPSQKRNLTRIDSNGRHLLEVINEILDITRIEAGRMPLHLSEFQLPELLQEVLAEMDPIIARSKLSVSTHLPPRLPVANGDRQKVKQIVLNLLSNALKFTHEGSVRISAEYHSGTSAFSIAVADTGIGIAPAYQEKIFEDFQQVDSSPTRAYGGTGLGLSICRRLATMLGGRVTLQSAEGQGSTFTLQFPRRARRS